MVGGYGINFHKRTINKTQIIINQKIKKLINGQTRYIFFGDIILSIISLKFDWKSQSFLILALAALNQFSTSVVTNMVPILLPDISLDFGVTIAFLNWISLIFLMALIAASIPLSKFISQYGVKRYTGVAIWCLIITLLISSITSNMELFLISRIVQGFSVAILYVSIYMIIILGMDENKTGKTLGIVGSFGILGLLISPSLVGFITYYTSWRFTFFIIIPALLLQLIIIHFINDEWCIDKTPIDILGSIMYVSLIVFLVYGLSEIYTNGTFFLLMFAIILIAFILYEKKQEFPVYNLKLFNSIKYVIGNYAAMANYFVTFIAAYILSIYLQVVMGFDSRVAGLIMITSPIIMVFIAPYAGRLSDRKDPRLISAIAMVFICIAMIVLVFMQYLPFYIIFIALIIQGIGHGMFSSPNNRYVLTLVSVDDLSDASALLSSIKEIGKMLSLAIFNIICVLYVGNVAIEQNVDGLIYSSRIMMNIAVIISLSSVILLLYSKYHYRWVENQSIISIFTKIIPKWAKK